MLMNAARCQAPISPTNGYVTSSLSGFAEHGQETTATYSCKPGFLLSGAQTVLLICTIFGVLSTRTNLEFISSTRRFLFWETEIHLCTSRNYLFIFRNHNNNKFPLRYLDKRFKSMVYTSSYLRC